MKKAIAVLGLVGLSFGGEIDQMWNYLYNQIAGCIRDEISSYSKKPLFPIRTKEDLLLYLKSLDLPPGYYVVINAKWLTSPQVCYIRWKMRQMGYNSHFYAPANILVVAVVQRKADAIALVNEVKHFVNPSYVFYVPVFP